MTTVVSSGHKRQEGAGDSSGEALHPACFPAQRSTTKDWSPGTREVWVGFQEATGKSPGLGLVLWVMHEQGGRCSQELPPVTPERLGLMLMCVMCLQDTQMLSQEPQGYTCPRKRNIHLGRAHTGAFSL